MGSFLAGYKTYIAAAVSIAMGVAAVAGIDVPGVAPGGGLNLIMDGAMVFFLRMGIKNTITGVDNSLPAPGNPKDRVRPSY